MTEAGRIHAEAEAVLHFWLQEVPPENHFARDDALDAECARRFQGLRDTLAATGAKGWADDPRHLLAAVIALDQFSRNIYRGAAAAFAADPLARSLAAKAVAAGWDLAMAQTERAFLYLPFQHSEDEADQDRSVALFDALDDEESRRFARLHRDVIRRFGRFPGRNAALGRTDTPEEAAFLREDRAF